MATAATEQRVRGDHRGHRKRIDAREFGSDYPSYFPRFFSTRSGGSAHRMCLNVCNGNRIDDSSRCENWCCPMFENCDRVSVF